jgi:CubicO group peptidase (beta-lactamase class C family)
MEPSAAIDSETTGEIADAAAERFMQEMILTERFSGVVMVQKQGKVLHKRAYGPSSEGRMNAVNDRFHVASMTKQFTAAAIMTLVAQGSVKLDTGINEYLPKKYRSDIWAEVQVQHLLSHTSGIPDYAETRDYYEVVDGWAFGDTVDGMIREAMKSPLDFTPGDEFRYSNIGYTLLGEIIEAQTGEAFADYISERLLIPSGMRDSEIHDLGFRPKPHDALGLRWDEASGRHVKDDVLSLPVTPPDGGLVTTLDDFARWVRVYSKDGSDVLSRPLVERMMQQSAPTETYRWPERDLRGKAFYGFGLMRSGDLVMHEGYIVGFRSYFIYSPQDDLLIAVFSNNTHNDVYRIAAGLLALETDPH